jgi:hypothetical protein
MEISELLIDERKIPLLGVLQLVNPLQKSLDLSFIPIVTMIKMVLRHP